MRILVLEHLSMLPLPSGQGTLSDEGLAMLAAVSADLAAESDVLATAAVHSRLKKSLPDAVTPLVVDDLTEVEIAARAADFDRVLLIAPEIQGIAAAWSQRLESAGAKLLSPPAHVVRQTSDKLSLSRSLSPFAPPTRLQVDDVPIDWGDDLIVKPRFGVGSLFTAICNRDSIPQLVQLIRARGFADELLVQPLIAGRAVSAALVARGDQLPTFLPPAEQRILRIPEPSLPGVQWLKYTGGRLPMANLNDRTTPLLHAVADSQPSFHGWIGVDMILSASADVILDVNPRLTTSYLGYSRLFPGVAARLIQGRESKQDLALIRRLNSAQFEFDTEGHVNLLDSRPLTPDL